ncbi:neurotrophin receptor-interacting factor homolog [Alosa sapidissima]|uniref:neurotrophin receptor-interacting factor homolog n=1 Tax=Alosa sapidissima TaxID=34773 RepID=UPI001C09211A|nr:neurotrophin receptor-interacting factor homolog [Alosa sapidissima]
MRLVKRHRCDVTRPCEKNYAIFSQQYDHGKNLPSHQLAFSSRLAEESPRLDLPPVTPKPERASQPFAVSLEYSPVYLPTVSNAAAQQPAPAVVPALQPPATASLAHPQVTMYPGRPREPKLHPYQHGEDMENFLLRFERLARTWQWPEREWAVRLVPLLTGKALEAYSAMDEDHADDFQKLKEALLLKFDITKETYRQRFWRSTVPVGETPMETYHRLKHLFRRWVQPEKHTKEEIGEKVIMEQLLNVLSPEVWTWVREHEPEDGKTAAKLALQYINAHKVTPNRPAFTTHHRATGQVQKAVEPLPDLSDNLIQGGDKGP